MLVSGAEMTNGAFYINKDVECFQISQNGAMVTNHLGAGRTYMVGNTLLEMNVISQTLFYFAGGPIIEASSNAIFSINLFDQEVNNISETPRRAEFGNHTITLHFIKGSFSVIYSSSNPNSFMGVTTPFIGYQLNGGKYFFNITEKSSVVYVLDGMIQIQGDKKKNTSKGEVTFTTPFEDPVSGISDKVITSVKSLDQTNAVRFISPVTIAETKTNDVQFFIVNGRVIGIWMKP